MEKNKKINFLKIIIFTFLFLAVFSRIHPIQSYATEYLVQTETTLWKYGNAMVVKIPGRGEEYLFCIQRGIPFRSAVSELQFLKTSFVWGEESGSDFEGIQVDDLIPNAMRYLQLEAIDGDLGGGGGDTYLLFRGWGTWTMNSDKTDAVQTSTVGAPSSLAWQEVFDEDGEDNEDPYYEQMLANNYQRYGTPAGTMRRWFWEMRNNITGHEGCVDVFQTAVKPITAADAGFGTSQVYALAMLNYYIFDDPDSAGYSDYTKWRVEQIMSWGVQFNFVTSMGGSTGYKLTCCAR